MELQQWLQQQSLPLPVQLLITDHIRYLLADLPFVSFIRVVDGEITLGNDNVYWFSVTLEVTYLDKQYNVRRMTRELQDGSLNIYYRVEIPHYSGVRVYLWIPPSKMYRFEEFVQIVQTKLHEQLDKPERFAYHIQYEEQFAWRWY